MKKKRHPFAIIFMAVAIGASIPLGINRSLSIMRERAGGHYFYDDTGYVLYEGLEKRRAEASNLITVAKRYSSENAELTKLIDELEYQIKICEKCEFDYEDDTFKKIVESNAALDQPAHALAQALENAGLSEKDKKYPAQIIANMESEQDKLERSSYNDEADKYNQKLKSLKPFAVLEPMATFNGDHSQAAVESVTDTTPEDHIDQAAGTVAGRAEEFAGEVTERAEQFADNVAEQVDQAVTGTIDRVLG